MTPKNKAALLLISVGCGIVFLWLTGIVLILWTAYHFISKFW